MKEEIILWHGGVDLENKYREYSPMKSTKWEYGPGLYLSNRYDTISKYSKGNRSKYLVTIEKGNNVNDVNVKVDDCLEFIYIHGKNRKKVLEDIDLNINRRLGDDDRKEISIQTFINIVINNDALASTKRVKLNKFIVDAGGDYAIYEGFEGFNEGLMMVVFNNKKIKSVKKIMSNDLTKDMFLLDKNFKKVNERKVKL